MVLENSASWEPGSEGNEPNSVVPEIARGVPLIKVLGIGGAGSNAVSRMFKDKLPVVEYYALNTDAQHLFRCDVAHRIALGQNLTRGLVMAPCNLPTGSTQELRWAEIQAPQYCRGCG